MNNSSVTIVIPARYHSSRLPGKPLTQLGGKPLIQHVYEQAMQVPNVDQVVVATDDARIEQTVTQFGGRTCLVTKPCRTGTDRVAEVARSVPGEIFVNLQADEILLTPALLADLITPFLQNSLPMGTLQRQCANPCEFRDPSVVKVVTNREGQALYFSRAPIPHSRDGNQHDPLNPIASLHIGVYIFTRTTLLQFAELPTGELEEIEKLEQLRALEHGIPIQVWETRHPSLRIDTPADLEEANRSWEDIVARASS